MVLSTSSRRKLLNNSTNCSNTSLTSKSGRRLINTSSNNEDITSKEKSNKFQNFKKNKIINKHQINLKQGRPTRNAYESKKIGKSVVSGGHQQKLKEDETDDYDEQDDDDDEFFVDCDDNDFESLAFNHQNKRFKFDSIEEFKAHEKYFDDRLKQLYDNLKQLKDLGYTSLHTAKSTTNNSYLHELKHEINKLDKESKDNLFIVKVWFDKQKYDLETQFKIDFNRHTQEYQEKIRDLKENLKNEYDDMKKQLELDKTQLDINTEVTETKPQPTRTLRRRLNNNNNTAISNLDYSIDTSLDLTSSVGAGVIGNASVSSTSVLLQRDSLGSSINVLNSNIVNSVVGSSLSQFNTSNGYYSNLIQQSYYSNTILNNIAQSVVYERKRKLSPATITFAINEDELNEDFKYLIKNFNTINNSLISKNNKSNSYNFLPFSSSSSSSSSPSPKSIQSTTDA
jgi:hypothetical protein